ncbi:MAG: 16S rRNA (adenine(1518)-N(6)/adenine(1519)-N(6))-dimethyltransferase RsmA [Piscirickettsiaceae bacterium]|nr:16S rRNA (adenine(1518)-N(6)/adenine(1519)-N(6))-dimethyltransferase RsmA [Piscirickettsiaceae bacterium]
MSKSRLYPAAKKRFGQNFLHDEQVIADIVAAVDPQNGDHMVEIGPGRGALTRPLLQTGQQLDVIELDHDLVPLLQKKLMEYEHLSIHQADALAFDYATLVNKDEKLRIIGNLPYNITTPLLFHLLEQSSCIDDMCFMLQEEVVDRICAQPGSKTYGRLSIMVQYQCDAVKLFVVPAESFEPIPKVESAIIYLRPRTDFIGGEVPIEALNSIVLKAFSQRRKTIANTLKNMVSQDDLQADNIDLKQRPETISIEQYVAITRRWLVKNEHGDKLD